MLRARHNIADPYDLDNDLFRLMLDETTTYSCAVFERGDEPLADAQRRKYRRICEQLQLTAGDRVLEDARALGYDHRFERAWDFYLAFCEAAFRTRALRDLQLTLMRPFNEALA